MSRGPAINWSHSLQVQSRTTESPTTSYEGERFSESDKFRLGKRIRVHSQLSCFSTSPLPACPHSLPSS